MAIKQSIPVCFLALIDYLIESALFARADLSSNKYPDQRRTTYYRALEKLIFADEILDAQLTNLFAIYKKEKLEAMII